MIREDGSIKDYTDKPIIIVGAARSGTSITAASVHLCGAWKGDTVGPSRNNPKGMFENHELRENVIKPIFRSMGVDPLGQYPLPKTLDVKIPMNFKESVLSIIKKQGWTPNKPWMYKCAKMSLIWPIWKHAFPDSKWIIVRRKEDDIINSCLKTSFMRAFRRIDVREEIGVPNEVEGWRWWVKRHVDKFEEIIRCGINAKVVWPERMVMGDYSQMVETIEWLGLDWKQRKIVDFIDPKLWKSR